MMVARAANAARTTSAAASPHPSARWKRGASPVMLATLHGVRKTIQPRAWRSAAGVVAEARGAVQRLHTTRATSRIGTGRRGWQPARGPAGMAAVRPDRYASLDPMAADGRAHDSLGRPSVAAQLASTSAHFVPRPTSRPANPRLASVATALNMSSPTCLFVLERALAAANILPGDSAVLAALGPGFSSELVLMQGV